jgi:alkylresorcinol/alkylpyrone synthase
MTAQAPATAPGGRGPAVSITGRAQAFPAGRSQQELWDGYFARHSAGTRWARPVFLNAGVRRRHVAIDPLVEDASGWSTAARMQRFVAEAMPLGKEAVSGALAAAGISAGAVGLFSVVTCTGYATPGIDILLARDLGLPSGLQRLHVGHMGCYAALPGLEAVSTWVAARGKAALLLCVELCSLHVQPEAQDLQQVVAHALFSDAAAAVVVQPGSGGLEVIDTAALTDPGTADHMTWEVTDLGFRMGLAREVPDVLGRHVRPFVDELLGRHGLGVGDVRGWAVHPGGPRILDVVADRLSLPEGALDPSRRVLAEHGNCSSATTLVVLDDLLQVEGTLGPGDPVVALAFGPGLTLYGTLLRQGPA